ncbi:MAG: T9SS type A sorting domain-containing protein [Crocinitomicaceae bacterium]
MNTLESRKLTVLSEKVKAILTNLSFLLISSIAMSQQGIIWELEVPVADGGLYGNIRPRLSLGNDDVPIVLLSKYGEGKLFVARGNGTSFDTPVGIVPSGMETYVASWTGPDISANGNNVVVAFKAQPIASGNIYAVYSSDGGLTFSDTIRVDNHDIGRTWMPAIDMDENSNPYVTYMTFNASGGNERIAIAKSIDGGLTYEPQQAVTTSTPGVACDCCPPEILVKGQYQLALFRNNENNIRDTWGSLSTDFGATFNSTENLDDLGWQIFTCPATGPHGVIIGDSVYVASASQATGVYKTYVSSAGLSGGLNLTNVQLMNPPASPNDTQNYPRISGEGDTLVVVWEEKTGSNVDVWCSVTTDGNVQTLSNYKFKAHEDLLGLQGKPDVIYKNGYVHLVYQDLGSGDVIYKKGLIEDVTSISEELLGQINIFPNPSEGIIQINGISMSNLSDHVLRDVIGNEVNYRIQPSTNNTVRIELEDDVAEGMYFISLTLTTGQVVSRSFLVK